MKRVCVFLCVCIAFSRFVSANAESEDMKLTSEDRSFNERVVGTYSGKVGDRVVSIEIISEFGRLYAFTSDQYSYYATELIPVGDDDDWSSDSRLMSLRSWSNMSYAGLYFPGDAVQRLTITKNGIKLSDFEGDSDPLVSEDAVFLLRTGNKKKTFPYGQEAVGYVYELENKVETPEWILGQWNASWRMNGTDVISRVRFDDDSVMTLLLEYSDGGPPLLAKGGYAVIDRGIDGFCLCYMVNALHSGLMPMAGCASLVGDEGLELIAAEGEDSLLLPASESYVEYRQGADPLKLCWMHTVSLDDDKDYFEVVTADADTGKESTYRVMKYGETTFGWPSDIGVLELMSLRMKITTSTPMPVLCHTVGDVIDVLLILRDIDDDIGTLMFQAPFYPILHTYCSSENPARTADISFDENGDAVLMLKEESELSALIMKINKRIGDTFTAEDSEGRSVTFVSVSNSGIEIVRVTPDDDILIDFIGSYRRSE